ncbi:MAG: oxidoreductase, partial [Planctomycetes bacterium]|nr:oxidoreductase [Planctomycetota bacterium]
DTYMTDTEVQELPRVWAVGGDGGMGDIGFQNLSKVVLQNRPNVSILMLNTQVYSNTGGQNSDSSVMTGGFDMNQFGEASEGKLTELKSVAECFTSGHGSPFVAQVSVANTANMFKSIVDGLCYRGTAYFQIFTTCQPEHGVPDHASAVQAQRIRDSRGLPEFVFTPSAGEIYSEAFSLKGNPNPKNDWMSKNIPGTKDKYTYTAAHWAFTEARFRRHYKIVKAEAIEGKISLEDKLKDMTMDDVTCRRFVDPSHRAFVPEFGVYAIEYNKDGEPVYYMLSRHMVLFCVERRRAWRMMQSRAGVENLDYVAQKEHLSDK